MHRTIETRFVAFGLIVGLVLFVSGCGGLTKGKPAAEAAIGRFHQQMNEGRFEEIWNEAHEKFRGASSKEKYLEFMSAIERKLGKVQSSKNAGWKVNTVNFTTVVLMNQSTTFEKGSGTETFTFEMKGENALLVGYNIQSMDLIIK
jgi:hypothetical protein